MMEISTHAELLQIHAKHIVESISRGGGAGLRHTNMQLCSFVC